MSTPMILLARLHCSVLQHRTFRCTPTLAKKWKWLSKEEAAKEHEVTIGFRHGNKEDPEYWPPQRLYSYSPAMGDRKPPTVLYREYLRDPSYNNYIDRTLHKIFASTFMAYFFYNLYYNPGLLFGHYYIPKPCEYTDEELGIPPDDAPDPEYWGLHGKPPGAARYW